MMEFLFAFIEDWIVVVHGVEVKILFHGVYFGFFEVMFGLVGWM